MKKIIIDTNALISFVTDREPEQQAKIAKVFNDASQLKVRLLCPQNVLTEFIYVMDKVYHIENTEINEMVKDFIVLPGIEIVHEVNMKLLLSFWPEHFADYGDAIVAAVCKDTKGSSIASFDQKLRIKLKKLRLSVFSI
ncbi:MAG: PIN domain-containing protein [Desulfobacterales bacterium]|nr:MAG: PIN domain-containing protein [Desulfobacterales bacterium]